MRNQPAVHTGVLWLMHKAALATSLQVTVYKHAVWHEQRVLRLACNVCRNLSLQHRWICLLLLLLTCDKNR